MKICYPYGLATAIIAMEAAKRGYGARPDKIRFEGLLTFHDCKPNREP